MSRHLASITAALDQLLDEPVVLVGNSLGGATALRYAHVRPQRVRGLYLTSPGGAPFAVDEAERVQQVFAMRTPADARAFLDLVYHRPRLLSPVVARFVLPRARAPAVADLLRTLRDEHAGPTELAALAMPVTLLWGRADRLLPASALAYFRAHLPAHASIVEPDDLGHCPHLDDPRRLARLIAAFAEAV